MLTNFLKLSSCVVTVLAFLFMANTTSLGADILQPGGITFCKSITAQGDMVEPATDFTENTVAMVALFEEPCKTTNILFTIYVKESNLQNLVFREEMQVDPTWNNVLSQGIPFPGTGNYILSFMRPDGTILASGKVNITSEKPIQPMPEKLVMEGRTLSELFNHFKSQADKK